MKNKQIHKAKIIAAAASVCVIMAASTTAYAMNMFGLKDLVLSNTDSQVFHYETAKENTAKPSVSPVEFISLQGFANSNECKAVNEWISFRDNYDKDRALLKKVGNGPTGLDPKYDLYSVYTQEMADKLDEIAKKYNLKLHNSLDTSITTKELIQNVASGNFLGANINQGAYMYEDGTFKFDGLSMTGNQKINFQFSNFKKGTFNEVVLKIGDIKNYDEWDYTTTCGLKVRLAMGPEKSLVIADLGDSFMTINVLAGTTNKFLHEQSKITSSDLESFANSFDFTLIKSQVASSMENNKTGNFKITTRNGIIGEFQTLISSLPEISEVSTFIKDKAKGAKKEDVTEMLITLEELMSNFSGGLYEEMHTPEIQNAFAKADKANIDLNQADKLQNPKLKTMVEKAKANGLIISSFESSMFPTDYSMGIDYTKFKELCAYATADMIAYVDMQILEQVNPICNANGLAIGWDELIKRAISAEESLTKYESSHKKSNFKSQYNYCKKSALGDGTSVFDSKTKEIKADAKKAYETYISSNPNSKIAKTLKEFLNIVSQNENKLTKEVQDFCDLEILGKAGFEKKKAHELEMQK